MIDQISAEGYISGTALVKNDDANLCDGSS